MKKYLIPAGRTIKLPPGTRYVEQEGRVFKYFNPAGRRWYFVEKVSGGWRVTEYHDSEFSSSCCEG